MINGKIVFLLLLVATCHLLAAAVANCLSAAWSLPPPNSRKTQAD